MQKLQLSIPEPCHENWHGMTPTEQGRYCNACAKEVVDFSMMTDTEVLNYFTSITHEKVCGRALPIQLDRVISYPKEPKKRLFWYWNYIVMFFMFFSKSNTVKAQGNVRVLTASELSIVRQFSVNDAITCKVGETVKSSSRVISGKVTDIDGNPVSFATIKIKGTPRGLSADANGTYSMKVNPNDVFIISGAGYKTAEAPIGVQSVLNTVLEKWATSGEIVIITGCCFRNGNSNEDMVGIDKPKYNAILKIKDDASGVAINGAKIIIAKKYYTDKDTVFADKRGHYKLTGIKENDAYYVKVEAEGYEANEFEINGKEFDNYKKEWEVLLTRQKDKSPGIKIPFRKPCPGAFVKLDNITTKADSIYVKDGVIIQGKVDINPDDVEEYKILQAAEAMALFGPDGSNGAVVITTRQAKTKTLDSITVRSEYKFNSLKLGGMVGGIFVHVSRTADLKARLNTFINDSLKVYPNPVQRGNTLKISLKLKQAGNHNIQITDGAGRIVLQKQTNIQTKEYIEHVQTDTRWSSGVYYIRVFDNNNKLISNSSFIVQ